MLHNARLTAIYSRHHHLTSFINKARKKLKKEVAQVKVSHTGRSTKRQRARICGVGQELHSKNQTKTCHTQGCFKEKTEVKFYFDT